MSNISGDIIRVYKEKKSQKKIFDKFHVNSPLVLFWTNLLWKYYVYFYISSSIGISVKKGDIIISYNLWFSEPLQFQE